MKMVCLEKLDSCSSQKSKWPIVYQSLVHVTFSSKYIAVSACIEEQDLRRLTICQQGLKKSWYINQVHLEYFT